MSDDLTLTPQLLVAAYRQGIFPMAESRTGEIAWFSPDPRGIIPLDDRFHVPRNLAKLVHRERFGVRFDTAFERVARACAAPRTYEGETWINAQILDAYADLHAIGLAHSVEAWQDADAPLDGTSITDRDAQDALADGGPPGDVDDAGLRLVGGLYGVAIGGVFFGESMFSLARNASKVCLVHLVARLRRRGFTLLDIQFPNEHLAQFGALAVPRRRFMDMLADGLERDVRW